MFLLHKTMTTEDIYYVVRTTISYHNVALSKKNKKWLAIIQQPLGFHHFVQRKIAKPSAKNSGKAAWQRKLYDACDDIEWYDINLPIGQIKCDNGKISSYKIDMLGYEGDTYILCELKSTDYEEAPFDALLQLLAYYAMLAQNAAALDANNVHHTNARNSAFKWEDVCENVKLLLKAPYEYWHYWEDDNFAKHCAFLSIIKQCCEAGLIIETEIAYIT
jgi:hypothetical protein